MDDLNSHLNNCSILNSLLQLETNGFFENIPTTPVSLAKKLKDMYTWFSSDVTAAMLVHHCQNIRILSTSDSF